MLGELPAGTVQPLDADGWIRCDLLDCEKWRRVPASYAARCKVSKSACECTCLSLITTERSSVVPMPYCLHRVATGSVISISKAPVADLATLSYAVLQKGSCVSVTTCSKYVNSMSYMLATPTACSIYH